MTRFRLLIVGVFIMGLALGCAGEYIPSGPIVHEFDGAILDTKGETLNLKVVNFKWRYLKQTDQIKLWGWAQNMEEDAVQGCRIIVDAYDQFDSHLGTMETFLNPTYLAPEQTARFEIFLHRGHWVENIYLIYRFESRL